MAAAAATETAVEVEKGKERKGKLKNNDTE